MMGGAGKIMAKGRELFDQGKYRHGVEILNKLVYAEPNNQDAKDLLADMFEQLGYQYESASLHNSFLAGAKELRDGYQPGAKLKSASGRGSRHDNRAVSGLPRRARG
jgi:alkyl sulfatase BDS1-like metallo-beta-lactamase superfamily hydrolase